MYVAMLSRSLSAVAELLVCELRRQSRRSLFAVCYRKIRLHLLQ